MAQDFSESRLQLYRIAQLPADWDANGAPKFSERHLSHARYLLSILPKPPNIYPNPGKSIQFTYGNSNTNSFMELELFEDSTVRAFYKDCKGEYTYKMINLYKAPSYYKEFYWENIENENSNESGTG